jgi:hypothetical protein
MGRPEFRIGRPRVGRGLRWRKDSGLRADGSANQPILGFSPILHSLELGIARERRNFDRASEAARGKVANSEEFLARMRDRL